MADITPINIWTAPNDWTGDTIREWGQKINDNFTALNNDKLESSSYTAADVKSKYESNANTNAFTDGDKTKLDWIESWATANQTNAYLLDRTHHTWTQTASTISDFDTEVSNNETLVDAITLVWTISWNVLLDWFELSINAWDNTKFNIASWTAYVVDNFTDPANPTYTKIEYAWATWVTPDFLATNTASYPVLTTAWTLTQLDHFPTTWSDLRNYIWLWAIVHSNNININAISQQISQNWVDLVSTVQEFANNVWRITSWNAFYPASTDLTVAKSAWTTFSIWTNYKTNKTNPNISTDASQIPVSSIIYATRDWAYTTSSTVIPTSWDNAWVVNNVASLKYTIQRMYYSVGSAQVYFELWQKQYNSMADAIEWIDLDSVETSSTAQNLLFRGWLVVWENVTDLSNTARAKFLTANKFWDTSSVSGWIVASTVWIQEAYENWTEPEILTNSTRWALTIRQWSWADTDNIYEGKNWAWTTTFSVDGNWDVVSNNLYTKTETNSLLDSKQNILNEWAFVNGDKTKLDWIEAGAEVNTINSNPTWIIWADQVTNIVSLTQAEYDAITPNSSTFYIITT